MLVDSHAHLEAIDDLEDAIKRTSTAGVVKIVTIGTSIDCSKKCIELAEKYSSQSLEIYATSGIHPKDGKEDIEKYGIHKSIEKLRSIAKSSKKVVAIGECGLDYYLGDRGKSLETSEKEKKFQRELFEGQVKLAANLGLPLIIHCRNGWGEIFELIENLKLKSENLRGVVHSWTGDWNAAKRALDLDFYISFSGIVTFKNAPDIQEVAKKMPINRIFIETDSPFLSPEPFRGKTNEPKNVRITAQFLANLRGLPFAKIAEATTVNAEKLFGV